jgi:bacterioferritin
MNTAIKERPEHLTLDQAAIDAASQHLDDGAVTPSYGPWRDDIVKLLNDALATELVCVLRYKRHYFTANGVASPAIAEEFLVHANEESAIPTRSQNASCSSGASPTSIPGHCSTAATRNTTKPWTCRPWCGPIWWPSASP